MTNRKKLDSGIERFLEELASEEETAQTYLKSLETQRNLADFCYNKGRGRWRDVCDVDLCPGTVYIIRRVFWKTAARRGIERTGQITLARWRTSAPWEVLRGYLETTTASNAGIQVYE